MKKLIGVLILLIAAFAPRPAQQVEVRVTSKKFTESVILGEMIRILVEDADRTAMHLRELGGTRIVFEALCAGEVDVYTEYTGTLMNELFGDQQIQSVAELRTELEKLGIRMSEPLGFNNTYALGMLESSAADGQIETLSDLARVPELRYGLSSEFLEREDGWPGLRQAYGLNPQHITGLDHDLAYRQLQLGLVDIMDVYTTEARIDSLNLRVLKDDRQYFPRYDAVILYRAETEDRYADAVQSLLRLTGQIDAPAMSGCNRRVEIDAEPEQLVAADYLQQEFGVSSTVAQPGRLERITSTTLDHLELVRRSLLPAILCAIPIGVLAARAKWFGHLALAITGIFQTIPSFALLVMLIPLVAALGLHSIGAGSGTAVIALFLYSLLPIVRNTQTGLVGIDPGLMESAAVLNLPARCRLFEIELPLASPAILAGIKTAAVMNIGFATLGALVGAGGYGQPILSGIRLADTSLILEGAIPAAVMALVTQAAFELIERYAVPEGLRSQSS